MTALVADEALRADLVALRRRLHACAEVGLDLPRTQAALLAALDGLGLEVTTGRALTSVTAVLRGGRPGPVVLLRSDMDALPVQERTGLEFAASDGAMHACGHDLHMAGLVGAARLLAARREELPGTVVFMFQPGEEGWAGGRLMLQEGVLDAAGERPVAAYAVHVDCVTPRGQAVTRPGPMMASVSALRLRVVGTGGHAAYPHHGVDPVPAAAHVVLAVQSFVARRVPVADPAVVSVTRVASDSAAGNVLAAAVSLEANIRALSPQTLDLVRRELPAQLVAVGEAHGCTVEVEYVESYPVTVNDPAETEWVLAVLDELYGEQVVRLPFPGMASEDFAYVLEKVPGTLVFLGVRPEDGQSGPMHSEHAVFDDSGLGEHAALLAQLAWRRLAH
ncbi:amidohydrolase [Phycicoccus endophyticus]|uniref:Amidohydrolase n=1 Tax=Phycicoccus endophyticus TaxID=1690220 RepID=A0A7G9QZP4_9MICO|nr:M20 family metallopeptidase [Phycicoccus endophyticus]NHI20011.1 amidohydrolase [Phycicoccus endophyticus]QNN48819.1 amidohydrolase [Phycicoccus endophyticus]GGL42624.1 amidohydrolase [Phycicoccus endophyticus]